MRTKACFVEMMIVSIKNRSRIDEPIPHHLISSFSFDKDEKSFLECAQCDQMLALIRHFGKI